MIVEASTSGSATEEEFMELVIDEGDDILRPCAGLCGQKILYFEMGSDQDSWENRTDGAYCLECRAKMVLSGSLK